jgi:hypothetical protein
MSHSDRAPALAGAAPADHRRRHAEPSSIALDVPGQALWSEFGGVATERQRINLRFRDRFGKRVLVHAGHVLARAVHEAVEHSGVELPQQAMDGFQGAAAAFLEAAESIVDIHGTRLHLDPMDASDDPRRNGVVLTWRDGADPVLEDIALDAFIAGRWQGLMRSADPRYSATVATLMQQAATLSSQLAALAGGMLAGGLQEARLSIRTFDAGGAARAPAPPAWIPQLA